MTPLNLPSGAAATTPQPAPQASGQRPHRPWALPAAVVAGGLVLGWLGWHGGWQGAVGAACAISAGLGLPWLRRQCDPGSDSAGLVTLRSAEPMVAGQRRMP